MNALTETVRFDDGATTEVTVRRAAGERCVVIIPALGVTASYYRPLAEALARAGLSAVQFDLRGHGTSSVDPRRAQYGYGRLTRDLLDVVAWSRAHTGQDVVPLGHSLGGHLALLGLTMQEGAYPRVVTVASASPHHAGYPVPTKLGLFAVAAVVRMSSVIGYYPGKAVRFGGDQPLLLMREWSRFAMEGRLGGDGLPPSALAAPVDVPVLGVSIAGDSYATPAAVDRLMRFVAAGRATRVHLEDALAPGARDHFRWVRHPEPVIDGIGTWLGAVPASSG